MEIQSQNLYKFIQTLDLKHHNDKKQPIYDKLIQNGFHSISDLSNKDLQNILVDGQTLKLIPVRVFVRAVRGVVAEEKPVKIEKHYALLVCGRNGSGEEMEMFERMLVEKFTVSKLYEPSKNQIMQELDNILRAQKVENSTGKFIFYYSGNLKEVKSRVNLDLPDYFDITKCKNLFDYIKAQPLDVTDLRRYASSLKSREILLVINNEKAKILAHDEESKFEMSFENGNKTIYAVFPKSDSQGSIINCVLEKDCKNFEFCKLAFSQDQELIFPFI